VGLGAVVWLAGGCDDGIDTTRLAAPKATLGDDIYTVMCDRLGASSFTEDLTGASYHAICHFDASFEYGDDVDTSVLPPVSGSAAVLAREHSIAKLEQMARKRAQIIQAANAAFPDIEIPDPTSDDPFATVQLHDALLRFTQDLTKLYESNPYEPEGEPLMPLVTRSFGRLFEAMEQSDDARAALGRIAGRQGYRPANVQLGAVRTLLAYPEMRPFLQAQLEVLGPGGTAGPQLQQLLQVVEAELEASQVTVSVLPAYIVNEVTNQPNRPRSAIEVGRRLLLDQHSDYAASATAEPRYIALRDRRGFAVPLGSNPGVFGNVPSPFADLDNDGFADVDYSGRFVDSAGNPLALDSPFFVPGVNFGQQDAYGRPSTLVFEYLDTSRTFTGALSEDVLALVDGTKKASEGAAEPWLEENEALMYALSGLQVLAGPRAPAAYAPVSEAIFDDLSACGDGCISYQRFRAEDSPLPDLVHALGQVLADPDSDVMLLALMELIEEHPNTVARLIGAGLRVKAIADEHDALAAQGLEPLAELAYQVPVWDQIAAVVDDMVDEPGLIAALIEALADPVMVQPHSQDPAIPDPPAAHFGETLSAFMVNVDQYRYDEFDINGLAINVTDGYPSLRNPHNPVDFNAPRTGTNRSMFERAAQLIYDGNRVKACNKDGARVYTGFPVAEFWPLFGGYDECELFSFDNVGAFYLNATLPDTHPKRAELIIKPNDINDLLSLISGIASQDVLLENSSEVTGLTTHPTPQALNRLLFFGADSDEWGQLPDYDLENEGSNTATFINSAVEPLCGIVSPAGTNGVHDCNNASEVLRLRDYGVIFGWERLGFYDYLAPQLRAFAEVACTPSLSSCDADDYTGENFFLDLVSVLYQHWPGADHGDYCDSSVAPTDPRYCSAAGINGYEPILGDAFASDIMPALHEFASVAAELSEVTVVRGASEAEGCGATGVSQQWCRGRVVKGTEVLEWLVKLMFDTDYAAQVGMVDRKGQASTTWVDGTPQSQLTVYSMFADALHAMDQSFETTSLDEPLVRRSKWKRARSLIVDRFLTIYGEGAASEFENPATRRVLITALAVLREQLNANCPDREISGQCNWARQELSAKFEATLSRPVFAAVADLVEAINQHEDARRLLERLLSYALLDASSQDALQGMLTSLSDLPQLLRADGDLTPILNAAAVASAPRADDSGPGCADRTIQLLQAMSGVEYDRYHVLDHVLPALVTPLDGGAGQTPLEVFVDALADIHRLDASRDGAPLDPEDYRFVFATMREFFISETRGFEQLYHIVQNRPKE